MEKEKLRYIEEAGLLFESAGLTRMSGRIFGYLLICDEDQVSFNQIKEVLKASKGSISTNLKQLVHTEFIEPVSLPGDRKTYYRASHIHIGDILKGRTKLMKSFSEMFAKGRRLKDREDETAEWLEETSVFYEWIESEMDKLIGRWEKEKDTIIKKRRAS
ncbi:MAG: hypothetical protein WEA56_16950 [Balneolaceae bacterium]